MQQRFVYLQLSFYRRLLMKKPIRLTTETVEDLIFFLRVRDFCKP